MSVITEYDQYDGLGLASLVKNKDVTAEELLETAIQKIEKLNPKLNAVVTPMFESARHTVKRRLPDGVFAGVPFLLKDLLAAYAGVTMTSGSRAYKDYIPAQDSELVTRFKKTGVVTLGKTNCPELGLVGYTEPELHGPARNPWNLDHTPGGSSGGSASAVAGGMVPMASAGDGGGSIRIPAACCGLFGLKPTRGRVPTGPEHGELWQGAVSELVISRSVRDSAAMLDAVQGADVGAPYVIPEPETPYLKEMQKDPGRLTIAFNTVSPLGTPVDPVMVKAVENTAETLEKLGHHVEAARPDIDGKGLAKSYLNLYFGEVAADLYEMEALLERKPGSDDLEVITRTMGMMGRAVTAGEFVREMRKWGTASRKMGVFHQTYDLYMTPTMASPPARIGELKPKAAEKLVLTMAGVLRLGWLMKRSGILDKMAVDSLARTPFTQLANFTGQPAMSLPLSWTPDGLPCGIHFMGRFGDEATLFRLAAQLEKEYSWDRHRPPHING